MPKPQGQSHEPTTFEPWSNFYLEGPGAMPEALVVALAEGEVVGYAGMRQAWIDVSDRREHARPPSGDPGAAGIATALKLAQIERARLAGVEKLFTTNDEKNAGMREVNKRLGYKPMPAEIVVSGPSPV